MPSTRATIIGFALLGAVSACNAASGPPPPRPESSGATPGGDRAIEALRQAGPQDFSRVSYDRADLALTDGRPTVTPSRPAGPIVASLNKVHRRIHEPFTEGVDGLPGDVGSARTLLGVRFVNSNDYSVRVLVGSGRSDFDRLAVRSLRAALAVMEAPPQARSSDGAFYFTWTLFGAHVYGCSTYFVRPLLLAGTGGP